MVDLTAEDNDCRPEVSVVQQATRNKRNPGKEEKSEEELGNLGMFSLLKLFDKNLLSELISEDIWMDRIRRVLERNDPARFELMGPYINPQWNQLSVVDDCILVDNRLAVPGQLR